jgi:hypothetical protein
VPGGVTSSLMPVKSVSVWVTGQIYCGTDDPGRGLRMQGTDLRRPCTPDRHAASSRKES